MMRITRAGFGRPNQLSKVLYWARTTVLVSMLGMFISGAHDTYRWMS